MWKSEVVSGELNQLAEEISKQNVESAAWFVLSPLAKCERKKDGDVENELKNSHLRNGTNKTSNTGEVGGTDSLEKEGSENRDRF